MAPSDKFERLMNLLAALLESERPLSAEQIQSRVHGYSTDKDAFRRTFERDKDELRDLGVSIDVVDIPGTSPVLQGYFVDRNTYALPDPGLSTDEIAALRLAMQVVRIGDPDDAGLESTSALWRLGGVADAPDSDGTPPVAAVPVDPHVSALFRAMLERRVTSFSYRKDSESSRREVEPGRLEYRRGHWYLTAFDRDRQAQRNYRLDRIDSDIEVADRDSCTGPPPTSDDEVFRPWNHGTDETIDALLRVDSDQSPWATALLGAETVVAELPDGSIEFRVPVTSWPPFRSFVLSFLDHAELLAPPELRADLVAWLTKMTDGGAR